MKLLFIIFVFAWLIMLWRKRRVDHLAAHTPSKAPPQPQIMQACAHCGMHLPSADTVAGRNGVYCCVAHQNLSEH